MGIGPAGIHPALPFFYGKKPSEVGWTGANVFSTTVSDIYKKLFRMKDITFGYKITGETEDETTRTTYSGEGTTVFSRKVSYAGIYNSFITWFTLQADFGGGAIFENINIRQACACASAKDTVLQNQFVCPYVMTVTNKQTNAVTTTYLEDIVLVSLDSVSDPIYYDTGQIISLNLLMPVRPVVYYRQLIDSFLMSTSLPANPQDYVLQKISIFGRPVSVYVQKPINFGLTLVEGAEMAF